jgi:hypothetical protein
MQTRSKSKALTVLKETCSLKPLYEVNIDFDEASASWRHNKKDTGNGHYKYICTSLKKDDTKCGKICYKDLSCCWVHRKTGNK